MAFTRIFFAALYAVMVGWAFSFRHDDENLRRRWAPLYDPLYMLWVLIALFVVMVLMHGRNGGAKIMGLGASLLFHTLVFYALLLPCLPLLRRWLSARACATLWLLPNFLIFAENSVFRTSKPLLVLDVNKTLAQVLLVIWAVGAVAVLLCQIVTHLRFRRHLLRDAVPVLQGKVYAQWRSECQRADYTKTIPLLYSNTTATPVSIGLMRGSLRVLLPRRDYTEEELTLIFRHELYHCRHQDVSMKFLLSFCCALSWFNPLMWIARRRASEDLELGCDEEVMRYCNDHERQRYAQLILNSVADERGFTTCLSASAGALRYRLRQVVAPAERFSGSVFLGVVVLGLLLGYGHVDISLAQPTVGELLPFAAEDLRRVLPNNLDEEDTGEVYAWDDRLADAFLSLPLRSLSRKYDFDYNWSFYTDPCLDLYFANDDGRAWVEIYEEYVHVNGRLNGVSFSDDYLHGGAVDFDALAALLDFDAPDPTPAEIPDMFLSFDLPYDSNSTFFATADAEILSASAEGYWVADIGDVYTIENSSKGLPESVELHFGYHPSSWTLLAEPWEGGEKVVVTRSSDYIHYNGEAEYIVELLPYSAHYTVRADFVSEGVLFDMAFYFDVMVE